MKVLMNRSYIFRIKIRPVILSVELSDVFNRTAFLHNFVSSDYNKKENSKLLISVEH